MFWYLLILLNCLTFSCNSENTQIISVYVDVATNIGKRVYQRIYYHLSNVRYLKVNHLLDMKYDNVTRREECLILSFGNTDLSKQIINQTLLHQLPSESFIIATTSNHKYDKICSNAIAVDGLPLNPLTHTNVSFDKIKISYGALVGSYSLLELLGFGFLHPLSSYTPLKINLPKILLSKKVIVESPYWPERAFHLHTQHPLELTEVLQGHDIPQFGPHGPHCSMFSKRSFNGRVDSNKQVNSKHANVYYCERWEDMIDDVNRFFEWSIANRLNKIEWLLLGNYKWGNELDNRIRRFKQLTTLAHEYSLLVGLDVPIVNQQQHGYSMVDIRQPLQKQIEQMNKTIDWIFSCNFDFITTESGLSEFTHPECDLMLDLMNAFANHINSTWKREASIKVHCSTGQKCGDKYIYPLTGQPINFNFLPYFATERLGIFPHTIQVYSFDDPTANAYGNDNFSYIEEYMVYEAKYSNRSVVYYGETAYWVNVDIDVPLFMPLYGQRRLYDLRKIAQREIKENFRIQGQMNFDSGWEYGYWLSDLVTARASWDPILNTNLTESCNNFDQWNAFSQALLPFTRLFGEDFGTQINELLVSLTISQADLLVYGIVDGKKSHNIKKLSGIAYLSGDDTWIDLPRLFGLSILQPDKVRLSEHSDPDWIHIIPLLDEMDRTFSNFSLKSSTILANIMNDTVISEDRSLIRYLEEIDDCLRLLAMRSKQVLLLYKSLDPNYIAVKANLQRQSRSVIVEASAIVSRRETNYRVPWQRIGSWRENPTVYRYGYLWSVHSLYYWWRDQGLAEKGSIQSEFSPCYLNRMDASEVAIGWGKYSLEFVRLFINWISPFLSKYPLDIVNCFAPPSKEYDFPRDLYSV